MEKKSQVRFESGLLGRMLARKRKWENIGLRDAAKMIGTSAATLSRVESGKLPDLITCKRICDFLSIDINYFFTENNQP